MLSNSVSSIYQCRHQKGGFRVRGDATSTTRYLSLSLKNNSITMHIIKYSSLHTHIGGIVNGKTASIWMTTQNSQHHHPCTLTSSTTGCCYTHRHVWRNLLLVFKAKKDKRKSALHSSWLYGSHCFLPLITEISPSGNFIHLPRRSFRYFTL